MDAPWYELLVRLFVALAATGTSFVVWRVVTAAEDAETRTAALPLLRFLGAILGLTTAWRWFLLWLGFQTDLGHFGWLVPWVQPFNASLLFLLYLAIGLLAWYHHRYGSRLA